MPRSVFLRMVDTQLIPQSIPYDASFSSYFLSDIFGVMERIGMHDSCGKTKTLTVLPIVLVQS